jgi:hypothetical protein
MTDFGVIDLSTESPVQVTAIGGWGDRKINLVEVRRQLEEIRDAILPVATGGGTQGGFGLQSLVIALTVSAEGKILFVAKGAIEASISLTFARPETPLG